MDDEDNRRIITESPKNYLSNIFFTVANCQSMFVYAILGKIIVLKEA